MKFTILFLIIGLTAVSCFVVKQEIEIVMQNDDDSLKDTNEPLFDESESSDEEVDDQLESPILGCNGRECKNICWRDFKKAGSCYKGVCRCR